MSEEQKKVKPLPDAKTIVPPYLDAEQESTYEEILYWLYIRQQPREALAILDAFIPTISKSIHSVQQAEFYYLRGCACCQLISESDDESWDNVLHYLNSAREDLRKAYELGNQQQKYFLHNAWQTLAERRQIYESYQHLKKEPGNIDILLDVADHFLGIKKLSRAIQYLEQASVMPKITAMQKVRLSRIRSWVFIEQGQIKEARKLLEEVSAQLEQESARLGFSRVYASGDAVARASCILSCETYLIKLAQVRCHIDGDLRYLTGSSADPDLWEALRVKWKEYASYERPVPEHYRAVHHTVKAWDQQQIATKMLHESTLSGHALPAGRSYYGVWSSLLANLIKARRDPASRPLLTAAVHELLDYTAMISIQDFHWDDIQKMFQRDFPDFVTMNGEPITINSYFELLSQLSGIYPETSEIWLFLAEEAQRVGHDSLEVQRYFRRALQTLVIQPPPDIEQHRRIQIKALTGLKGFAEAQILAQALRGAYQPDAKLPNYLGPLLDHRLEFADDKEAKVVVGRPILLSEAVFYRITESLALAQLPVELIHLILCYLLHDMAAETPDMAPASGYPAERARRASVQLTPPGVSRQGLRKLSEVKSCPAPLPGLVGKSLSNLLLSHVQHVSQEFIQQRDALMQTLQAHLHQALSQSGASRPERQATHYFLEACKKIHSPLDMMREIIKVQKTGAAQQKVDSQGINFWTITAQVFPTIAALALTQQRRELVKALRDLQAAFPQQGALFAALAGRITAKQSDITGMCGILQSELDDMALPPTAGPVVGYQRYYELVKHSLTIFTQLAALTLPDHSQEPAPALQSHIHSSP